MVLSSALLLALTHVLCGVYAAVSSAYLISLPHNVGAMGKASTTSSHCAYEKKEKSRLSRSPGLTQVTECVSGKAQMGNPGGGVRWGEEGCIVSRELMRSARKVGRGLGTGGHWPTSGMPQAPSTSRSARDAAANALPWN